MMPIAVVTGGASGFGLALGERCAALGMDVALLDLVVSNVRRRVRGGRVGNQRSAPGGFMP
jgi:NAD(P)-dependent dehydrogenase (short-subunit alcohol dehydrogenase family)